MVSWKSNLNISLSFASFVLFESSVDFFYTFVGKGSFDGILLKYSKWCIFQLLLQIIFHPVGVDC